MDFEQSWVIYPCIGDNPAMSSSLVCTDIVGLAIINDTSEQILKFNVKHNNNNNNKNVNKCIILNPGVRLHHKHAFRNQILSIYYQNFLR